MEVLSGAASVVAFASVAVRLAEGCVKLYQFWESIQEAPEVVAEIMSDLNLLSAILLDISHQEERRPAVSRGLESCEAKLLKLQAIVKEFDSNLHSHSRRERLWSAFKATAKAKQLQDFRDSLDEAKSSLMLALISESVNRPQIYLNSNDVQYLRSRNMANTCSERQLEHKAPLLLDRPRQPKAIEYSNSETFELPPRRKIQREPIQTVGSQYKPPTRLSQRAMNTFMNHSLSGTGTVEDLMNQTIDQMAPFDPVGSKGYNGYNEPVEGDYQHMNGYQKRNRAFRHSRPRVSHGASSMGVLVGNIWTRTATVHIDVETDPKKTQEEVEVITSYVYYPADWLMKVGFNHGIEATLKQSGTTAGWNFVLNPIHAVPRDSIVFEFCKTGNVEAVALMMQRGETSVRDTSPEGWTPLHFAAAGSHVDLCAYLIEAGADKSALVYKGPSKDALSPVSIFAESANKITAEEKIRGLRLWTDCMELSEPSSDGWTVIQSLVNTFHKENVSVSENSATWFLRITSSENLVDVGPKTIWIGTQHAVRSFLAQEREDQVLQSLLCLDEEMEGTISVSHAKSIAHWLALRACQRELLPMIIEAGQFTHITGFDIVADRLTPRQYYAGIPAIYAAWTKAMPNNLKKMKELVAQTFEEILEIKGWTRDFLVKAISFENIEAQKKRDQRYFSHCTMCGDDYNCLETGLIAPRLIAYTECIKTNHAFNCTCSEFLEMTGGRDDVVSVHESSDKDDSDDEEEVFYDVNSHTRELFLEYVEKHMARTDVDLFQDTATLLYRAQGRNWMGSYKSDDIFCMTCLLKGEIYLGKSGLVTEVDPPPVPKSYEDSPRFMSES